MGTGNLLPNFDSVWSSRTLKSNRLFMNSSRFNAGLPRAAHISKITVASWGRAEVNSLLGIQGKFDHKDGGEYFAGRDRTRLTRFSIFETSNPIGVRFGVWLERSAPSGGGRSVYGIGRRQYPKRVGADVALHKKSGSMMPD